MTTPDYIDAKVNGVALRCHLAGNATEIGLVLDRGRDDAECLNTFLECVSPGDLVVDLGANCGLYTLLAAKAVGAFGHVIAVEPSSAMLERLMFNISTNAFDNIAVVPCAISDEAGTDWLNIVDANQGASSLHPVVGEKITPVQVAIRTLLDVLAEHHVQHIDAMKIDIEGYEDRAIIPLIEHAPHLWPKNIMLETRHAAFWRRDCVSVLLAAGYVQTWAGEYDAMFRLS